MTTADDDTANDDTEEGPRGLDTDALPLSAQDKMNVQLRDHTYKIALAAGLGLLAMATVVYRLAEEWSWVDSFYFSAVAVTTVGFGDLSPTTDATKLFTVFYIFMGISLLAGVLNEALRRHALRVGTRRSGRSDD